MAWDRSLSTPAFSVCFCATVFRCVTCSWAGPWGGRMGAKKLNKAPYRSSHSTQGAAICPTWRHAPKRYGLRFFVFLFLYDSSMFRALHSNGTSPYDHHLNDNKGMLWVGRTFFCNNKLYWITQEDYSVCEYILEEKQGCNSPKYSSMILPSLFGTPVCRFICFSIDMGNGARLKTGAYLLNLIAYVCQVCSWKVCLI